MERPTSFFSGCRMRQLPSYGLVNPLLWLPSTAHTSSAESPLHFSRMESGTLGRPSSNRSNGFLAVYFTICSFVKVNICAWRGTSTNNKAPNADRKFFMRCNVSFFGQCRHAGKLDAGEELERGSAAGG